MATASVTTEILSSLMTRIAAGEREALRLLYQATSAKLFGACLRILSDREESEDVLQDVYVTIWRRADRFDATRAGVMTGYRRSRGTDRLTVSALGVRWPMQARSMVWRFRTGPIAPKRCCRLRMTETDFRGVCRNSMTAPRTLSEPPSLRALPTRPWRARWRYPSGR